MSTMGYVLLALGGAGIFFVALLVFVGLAGLLITQHKELQQILEKQHKQELESLRDALTALQGIQSMMTVQNQNVMTNCQAVELLRKEVQGVLASGGAYRVQ